MAIFKVPVEKAYYHRDNPEDDTKFFTGTISVEAESMGEAIDEIGMEMGLRKIQTTDPRIEWDDDGEDIHSLAEDGYVYEDWSFKISE